MFDDFDWREQESGELDPRWRRTCLGGGRLSMEQSRLRLELEASRQGEYSDAQIDDYGELPRRAFPWHPPLRLEVRASFSHPAATLASTAETPGLLRGTAGFGFWNYPFSLRGDILMLPEAVWFFYASPPSNMALVPGVPGWGWKAQVVHALRPSFLTAAVPTALTALWGRLSGELGPAARWLQRLTGAQERLLEEVVLTDWHTYALEWLPSQARFFVDGSLLFTAPSPPVRPLGFVAWVDNQYAIATPRATLRFGTIATGRQWLDLDYVRIEPL
jgi:hypothetical protein